MASPRPLPPASSDRASSRRVKGSKIRSRMAPGMGVPSLATTRTTPDRGLPYAIATVIVVAACRSALGEQKPIGRQLGFLAQELGREVNTMGSKANDAVIQQHVIAMKGELEKFREQLENLE